MEVTDAKAWSDFVKRVKANEPVKANGKVKRFRSRNKKLRPAEIPTPSPYRGRYDCRLKSLNGGGPYYPSASDPGAKYAAIMVNAANTYIRWQEGDPSLAHKNVRPVIYSRGTHGRPAEFGARWAEEWEFELPDRPRSKQEDIAFLQRSHEEQAREQRLRRLVSQLRMMLGTLIGDVKETEGYSGTVNLTGDKFVINVRDTG